LRTWEAESAGPQLQQVVGRKEILILRMLANEIGDVGTERDNPEMIGAGEIERKSGEFGRQAPAFQRLRYFGVVKNDTLGKAAIGEQRTKAIDGNFEPPGLFVVSDTNVVEVHAHGSPCGHAGFFEFLHEDLRVTGKVYQEILQN
jgi:hypothetical protein